MKSMKASNPMANLEIRVGVGMSFQVSGIRKTLAGVRSLTILIRGGRLDGALVREILCNSPQIKVCSIYRKDNDWDAPNTKLQWDQVDDEEVAAGLQNQSTLEKFSITGFTRASPLTQLVKTLVGLPNLSLVRFQAHEQQQYNKASLASFQSTLSPDSLRQLLSKESLLHLSLLGIFPETDEYRQVLQRVYVQDACSVHIYLQFSTDVSRPSSFAYYIRSIMELNQNGRAGVSEGDSKALLKFIKRVKTKSPGRRDATTSLDLIYLLVRENPWLCGRRCYVPKKEKKCGIWSQIRRRSSRRMVK